MDKNSALSEDIASVNLSEAVAERIFQGLTAETDFGIISVFKDGICIEENRLRSEHFEKDVERLRFGYNKIKGYCFAEGGAKALEDEFLIVYSLPERGEELKNFLKSACRQFSQNPLLFVADGEAFSWQPEKVKSVLGTFRRRELPRFLSMVRGKPAGRVRRWRFSLLSPSRLRTAPTMEKSAF